MGLPRRYRDTAGRLPFDAPPAGDRLGALRAAATAGRWRSRQRAVLSKRKSPASATSWSTAARAS